MKPRIFLITVCLGCLAMVLPAVSPTLAATDFTPLAPSWPSNHANLDSLVELSRSAVLDLKHQHLLDPDVLAQAYQPFLDSFWALAPHEKQLHSPALSLIALETMPITPLQIDWYERASRLLDEAADNPELGPSFRDRWRPVLDREGAIIHYLMALNARTKDHRTASLRHARLLEARSGHVVLPVPDEASGSHAGDADGFVSSSLNPKIRHLARPEYPEMARMAQIEGTVLVKVLIGHHGTVEDAQILQGVNPILDKEALKAARQCLFIPGSQRWVPVRMWMALPYNFRLN